MRVCVSMLAAVMLVLLYSSLGFHLKGTMGRCISLLYHYHHHHHYHHPHPYQGYKMCYNAAAKFRFVVPNATFADTGQTCRWCGV